MTPCPFTQTDARRRRQAARAREELASSHAGRAARRARLACVPAAALAGGVLVYLGWVLATARGLLGG
ncbi:MAG: hypothetical protein IT374_21660 [Polyangiaceae bacterium]|nr:hypothetical protein [Polyangiaceae bacterium]